MGTRIWNLKDAGVMLDVVGKTEHKAALGGLLAAAHRVVEHIVSTIIPSQPRPPVDRSAYRAAWRALPTPTGAFVENRSPQAPIIEGGARAASIKIGRKMIEALAAWVKRKRIGGRVVTSKTGATRHVRASDAEATSIAWAIAKSFQKRGIYGEKGLRILEQAERQLPRYVREEVARALKHAVG